MLKLIFMLSFPWLESSAMPLVSQVVFVNSTAIWYQNDDCRVCPVHPTGNTEVRAILAPEESSLKRQAALYRQCMYIHVLPIMKSKDRGMGRRKAV